MFPDRMAVLAVTIGLLNLPSVAATAFPMEDKKVGAHHLVLSPDSMQEAVLSEMIAESVAESITKQAKQRRDAVHRCHQPVAEFGPAPSADDCDGAIRQLRAIQGDITVKLVEGCYQVFSGGCTASVCPQRVGTSTISPSLAAQYMTSSIMSECIANGLRGWYLDRAYGVGLYLT